LVSCPQSAIFGGCSFFINFMDNDGSLRREKTEWVSKGQDKRVLSGSAGNKKRKLSVYPGEMIWTC